jgi:protein phosphatase PTC7
MWNGKRTSVYVPGKGWRVKPSQQQQYNRQNTNNRTNLLFTDLEEEENKAHYYASIDCGSFAIPHPQKQEKGGEDSHFTFGKSEQGSSRVYSLTMGVADGVSGWAADGVDPALYARELSLHGEVAAKNSGIFEDDPYNILDYAHSNSVALGSSTCTIANITSRRSNGKNGYGNGSGGGIALLKWTNVGDSGVKVFRNGRLVAESPVQEHYFNCPRQLANPKLVKEGDTPAVAQDDQVDLRKGDTIVLATDGVFDNMYDNELGELVARRSLR